MFELQNQDVDIDAQFQEMNSYFFILDIVEQKNQLSGMATL